MLVLEMRCVRVYVRMETMQLTDYQNSIADL